MLSFLYPFKKKIKIRFIARCMDINAEPSDYLIQRKTLFGWRYIKYEEASGFGYSAIILYCNKSKEELLNNVFKNYYRSCLEFYSIEEYPMIKSY